MPARLTEAESELRVLDLTAGNRAIWFDKSHPCAIYVDTRAEVSPQFLADSRALPAEVGSDFDLVVFDPPHKNNAASGNMAKNYGHFTASEIRDLIASASREAWRVSKPNALMAFKWNDHSRKLIDVLAMMPDWEPLFGHGVSSQQRSSMTSWVMLRRRAALSTPTIRSDDE